MKQLPDPVDPRSIAYEVLGAVFRSGLQGQLRAHVAAFPPLARPAAEILDSAAASELHQRILGFEVFPFEGVFLSPEARVGAFDGTSFEELLQGYGPASRLYLPWPESPDHIGRELSFLSCLCQEETARPEAAELLRSVALHFLDEHLLRWLPALSLSLSRQGSPFYAALGAMALSLALDHRASLRPSPTSPHPRLWTGWQTPEGAEELVPELLAWLQAPQTGLLEIADYLITPSRSGLFLSRRDIQALGQPDAVPMGFGERKTMLANLLREAGAYSSLLAVLAGLVRLIEEAGAFHATQPDAQTWIGRLTQTRAVLERMIRETKASGPSGREGRERTPDPS